MKDIVIIADFCGPMDGTFNSRFLYLADLLCENSDNKVEVITSDYCHGSKSPINRDKLQPHKYKITLLHEFPYKRNISFIRFLGHFTWGYNVKKYLEQREKPDVVYCAIPPLSGPYFAAKYCDKNGIDFVIDIQDLWPEAYKMVFNVPIVSDVLFFPFNYLANGIYKRANEIVAVSQTYVDRALKVNEKCSKGFSVFLGTNLDTFDINASKPPVLDKQPGEKWLAYCGSLGSSYDLTCVIDALDIINQNRIAPKFIVMGSGPREKEFKDYAYKKKMAITSQKTIESFIQLKAGKSA